MPNPPAGAGAESRGRARCAALCFYLSGCASHPSDTPKVRTANGPLPSVTALAAAASAPSTASAPSAPSAHATLTAVNKPGCTGPDADAATLAGFSKAFDEPVSSLALGHAGRAAVLSGTSAHLFDGKRWVELAGSINNATADIFFGRDNAPRVLGFSARGSGDPDQVYLRCRNHRCQPAPDEIGRLGGAQGALYGVLGFDDPEVVCRAGQICLIKRISGWKSVPAHAQPVRVVLSAGVALALHPDRVERLSDQGFAPLTPARPFREPRAAWIEPSGVIWLIDGAGQQIVRKAGEAWQEEPSPVSSAHALWGSASDDVWLVGEGGAAHFDGKRWACVPSVPGPLAFVMGSKDELWLAGRGGAWRRERDRSPRNRE